MSRFIRIPYEYAAAPDELQEDLPEDVRGEQPTSYLFINLALCPAIIFDAHKKRFRVRYQIGDEQGEAWVRADKDATNYRIIRNFLERQIRDDVTPG